MSEQHDRLVARSRRTRLTTSALTFLGGIVLVVGLLGHRPALTWTGVGLVVVACVLTVLGGTARARAGRAADGPAGPGPAA